jgi:Zeta toxin
VTAPVLTDPLDELRFEIEEAAADETVTAQERTARLRDMRERLNDLIGNIDSYIGDNRIGESEHDTVAEALAELRENADIRDELLQRGLTTEDALDEAGLLSHEELDRLAEEDLLISEAFGLAGIARRFDEKLHPRGRGGKWIETMNKIKAMPSGKSHHVGSGVHVKKEGDQFHVQRNGKTLHKTSNPETAARRAHAHAGASDETTRQGDWIRQSRRGAATPEEKARAASETESRKAEQGLSPEEKKKLYDERKASLEKRVAEKVTGAQKAGKLTDAEAHFNDAGKVSQRSLGTYVDQASTKPQTIDLYSHVDPHSGERVWDESRKALHEKIITAFLKKRVAHPETGKPVLDFSDTAEDLQPHPDGPQVLFSGGGYAAGKGGVLKLLAAKGELPPDSFTLDPDQIKAELPEFMSMIGTDPEANMHTYQEAWAIAQEIQARAQEKQLNITVDGISNTSPDEMIERARSFTSRGYKAKAVYVDIPTEEALRRAANRAENAKDDSDRRMIPEVIMRSVHRDVAATVPSLLTVLQHREDVPLDLEVWNNDQGKDADGNFRPPAQFVDFKDGQMQVLDQGLWQDFVAKGHESILGVDAAGTSAPRTPRPASQADVGADTAEMVAGDEAARPKPKPPKRK